MWKSVRLLTWLSLCNLFGFNEARYGKDKKKRSRLITVGIAYVILGAMLVFYVGILTYGFITLGLGEILPLYLGVIIALITFMFTVFRAGSDLFSTRRYEMLAPLPVPSSAIVISRFLTVYITDLIISLVSTVTVMVVCAFTLSLSPVFCILMFLGAWILPLLPMTASMIVGTGIYAVTARMKRKNIMQIIFSLTFFVLYFSFLQSMDGETEEIINGLAGMMDSLKRLYPPAAWFSDGVNGNIGAYLLFVGISFAMFFAFAFAVGRYYKQICTGLTASGGKRNYIMREQKKSSAFSACFFRERKRYFSSSVYVMNTAIGYIMTVFLVAMLSFSESAVLFEQLPSAFTSKLAPFILAFMCNMSPSTSSAFSMEGKHFWLTQTLPVRLRDLVNAKIAVSLMIAVPSVLISSSVLAFVIRPAGLDIFWLFFVPVIYAVFGAVFGLFVNMKMPMMHWDHEAQPVKQGKAVLVMMLCGFASACIPVFPLFIFSGIAAHILMALICAVLCLLIFLIYRKLCALRLTALAED